MDFEQYYPVKANENQISANRKKHFMIKYIAKFWDRCRPLLFGTFQTVRKDLTRKRNRIP